MARGRPAPNLLGQRFAMWMVIGRAENRICKRKSDGKVIRVAAFWRCKCICGDESDVAATHLRRGMSRSCGSCTAACQGCGDRISNGLHCQRCRTIHNNLRSTGADCTVRIYLQMMALADGKCSACGSPNDDLVLDHDHATGKPRGIVCRPCNSAEGFFKNDYTRLLRLYDYCQRHANG